MILERVSVIGALETNTYFCVDNETNHSVIIDPGAEATKLAEIIRKKDWIIEKILITHGHLADSIFNRIFTLPEETLLYSGHSDVTSVKAEKSRYTND